MLRYGRVHPMKSAPSGQLPIDRWHQLKALRPAMRKMPGSLVPERRATKFSASPQLAQSLRIQPQQYAEQDGKGDHAAAAVAEEGQRNADHGGEADGHAHVDHQVQEEDAGHAICIDPREP